MMAPRVKTSAVGRKPAELAERDLEPLRRLGAGRRRREGLGARRFVVRRGVAAPGAHLEPRRLCLDFDPPEAPVVVRVRRVVPEQVVRRHVVHDPPHAGGEIVRVDDGEAVGVLRERQQRILAERQRAGPPP